MNEGAKPCGRCNGCKQIANDDDGTPWHHWAALNPPENIAVQFGLVFPIQCPRCQGSGKEPDAAERGARLVTAAHAVVKAWEKVGDCEDEFEGDPGACGEWRDALDDAVIKLKDALE